MIHRLLPRLAIATVASISLIFVAWLILARQIEERVLAWAEMRRAEGYTVAWQTLDVAGFPLSFELAFTAPRIAKDGWTAEAAILSATLLPWRPDKIDLATPRLAVAGPGASGTLDRATASLLTEGGRATRLTVDGIAATGRLPTEDLGRAARARLVIDRFAPTTTDWQTESLTGKVTLWRAEAAQRFVSQLLFAEPFDLDLEGAIKGPIRDLAGWRDAGGTAEVTRLVLAWGPLKLDGNATLSLDRQMRPLGAGTAKVQGLNPVLDRLVAKGQVKAQDASIAKLVLGLMAQPTAAGGSEVTVPVTAQDGKLFLGPVPVATLRPLIE
ncbi:MAG: DUF2125 domain-containing protein [Alphaproteobacteria bacterium]|nr:DUF2125 domain-containing protein [Alphaproteobacteria bacterium]